MSNNAAVVVSDRLQAASRWPTLDLRVGISGQLWKQLAARQSLPIGISAFGFTSEKEVILTTDCSAFPVCMPSLQQLQAPEPVASKLVLIGTQAAWQLAR